MDILAKRPNILFLVAIRSQPLYKKLLVTKLRRDIYHYKLNIALTVHRYETNADVWRLNDKIHRINGPAIIVNVKMDDATLISYINKDGIYRSGEYWIYMSHNVLSREYYYPWNILNPETTSPCYKVYYVKHGKIHRDTLSKKGKTEPAIISNITEYNPKGDRKWYQNNKMHREDGPASTGKKNKNKPDGKFYKEWYLNNILYHKKLYKSELKKLQKKRLQKKKKKEKKQKKKENKS